MVHSEQTLQPQPVRVLLAIETIFEFQQETPDVPKAYFQHAFLIKQNIYVKTAALDLDLQWKSSLLLNHCAEYASLAIYSVRYFHGIARTTWT